MPISHLGALIHTDRTEAKRRVLHAIEAASGDRRAAAKNLGTTHRNLYRFIERLGMWDAIDKLMADRRFPVIPGPPRSASRIRAAVLAAEGDLAKASRALDLKEDALRERIATLRLWDDLDCILAAARLPPLDRRLA